MARADRQVPHDEPASQVEAQGRQVDVGWARVSAERRAVCWWGESDDGAMAAPTRERDCPAAVYRKKAANRACGPVGAWRGDAQAGSSEWSECSGSGGQAGGGCRYERSVN